MARESLSSEARLCCNLSEQKEEFNCRSSISGYEKFRNRVNQRLSTAKSKESVAIAYYQFARSGAKNCGINSGPWKLSKLDQNYERGKGYLNV
jgi:hypothetical protein